MWILACFNAISFVTVLCGRLSLLIASLTISLLFSGLLDLTLVWFGCRLVEGLYMYVLLQISMLTYIPGNIVFFPFHFYIPDDGHTRHTLFLYGCGG